MIKIYTDGSCKGNPGKEDDNGINDKNMTGGQKY